MEVENDIASDFKVLADQDKLYISLKRKRFRVAGFVVVLLEADCAKNLLVYYFEHTVLLHALLAFLNVVLQASYFMIFKEMRFFVTLTEFASLKVLKIFMLYSVWIDFVLLQLFLTKM